MQTTFIHRLLLAAIAGLAFALLIQFYRTIIVGSERAMNAEFEQKRKPHPSPPPRR